MIYKKHSFQSTVLAALLCGAPFISLHAQNPGGGDQPRPPHGPPPSPLFDALDTNHDGVISAEEIANATTALKGLLKDGATGITRDDVRPPHPPREREEPAAPHSRPDAEPFRPHLPPPPADDRAADDARPPRAHEDADHADHAFHRPPPRTSDDDWDMDEHARPHPPMRDDADRPDADAERPRPFRDDAAEPPHRHHAPPSPLFDALDTNHDGVISVDEMANAAESLKKLDKTGTGQLRREDLKRTPPAPPNND